MSDFILYKTGKCQFSFKVTVISNTKNQNFLTLNINFETVKCESQYISFNNVSSVLQLYSNKYFVHKIHFK